MPGKRERATKKARRLRRLARLTVWTRRTRTQRQRSERSRRGSEALERPRQNRLCSVCARLCHQTSWYGAASDALRPRFWPVALRTAWFCVSLLSERLHWPDRPYEAPTNAAPHRYTPSMLRSRSPTAPIASPSSALLRSEAESLLCDSGSTADPRSQSTSKKGSKMQQLINYRIRVALKDSRSIVGQMLAFDQHMNLVLADADEFRSVKRKCVATVFVSSCPQNEANSR